MQAERGTSGLFIIHKNIFPDTNPVKFYHIYKFLLLQLNQLQLLQTSSFKWKLKEAQAGCL